MKKTVRLVDGYERHQKNPHAFMLPPPSLVEAAMHLPGSHVKIGFYTGELEHPFCVVENMWVEVTGPCVGVLDNDPCFLTDIQCGDEVRFEARHVLDFHIENRQ